jgi:hypothetical protein
MVKVDSECSHLRKQRRQPPPIYFLSKGRQREQVSYEEQEVCARYLKGVSVLTEIKN